jgi:hypothetical protein
MDTTVPISLGTVVIHEPSFSGERAKTMNQISNINEVTKAVTGMLSGSMAIPGVEVALPLVSRIYLGAAIPGGGWVSRDAFKEFLDDVVTKWFPNGFTVLAGDGVWKDTDTEELVFEKSRVIEVAHGYEDRPSVGIVAHAYKNRFDQQAVMVSTVEACVSFV